MNPPLNARFFSDVSRTRVNRSKELDFIKAALLKRCANIFLYGPRGVGKTFLLRMLVGDLLSQEERVFSFLFPVDLAVVQVARTHGDSSAFPLAFLYSLLAAAWATVTGAPHISLALRDQSKSERAAICGKLDELITQIRRQVFLGETESAYHRRARLEDSPISEGEIVQEWRTKETLLTGHEAEVRHYIADLQKAIQNGLRCDRIVALCDEANLLPEEWQKKLIGGHIRELSDLGIQFVFVAGYVEQLKPVNLPEYFDFFLEITGFPKAEFRELVGKYFPEDLECVSAPALDSIYAFTNGNPRLSLGIVADAIDIAKRRKRKVVSVGDASLAIGQARKQLAAMRAALPRKRGIR